ncbi:hypothetical protein L2734_02555 [Parashewanella spongiae]|nr:hypothetical protein [Parashewanella spongiae]MCL1077066.1 hypothetical protein [Parashewanella spongiae]
MKLVRALSKDIFVIMISHDLDVLTPNDRVIQMGSGQIESEVECQPVE